MESTDGTVEIIQSVLPEAEIVSVSPEIIFERGFGEARNLGAAQATSEYIFALDCDELIAHHDVNYVRNFLQSDRPDLAKVTRLNLDPRDLQFTDALSNPSACPVATEEKHARIYRPESGVKWRGYLHEELFAGAEITEFSQKLSEVVLYHFSEFRAGRSIQKRQMYHWMLLNAAVNEELQIGANPWWYNTYVPQNLELMLEDANQFAARTGRRAFSSSEITAHQRLGRQ